MDYQQEEKQKSPEEKSGVVRETISFILYIGIVFLLTDRKSVV